MDRNKQEELKLSIPVSAAVLDQMASENKRLAFDEQRVGDGVVFTHGRLRMFLAEKHVRVGTLVGRPGTRDDPSYQVDLTNCKHILEGQEYIRPRVLYPHVTALEHVKAQIIAHGNVLDSSAHISLDTGLVDGVVGGAPVALIGSVLGTVLAGPLGFLVGGAIGCAQGIRVGRASTLAQREALEQARKIEKKLLALIEKWIDFKEGRITLDRLTGTMKTHVKHDSEIRDAAEGSLIKIIFNSLLETLYEEIALDGRAGTAHRRWLRNLQDDIPRSIQIHRVAPILTIEGRQEVLALESA